MIKRFLFIAVILSLVYPVQMYAHPPEDVLLKYDLSSQTLIVNISHITKSPDSHYVNKIEITRNGRPVGTYNYQNQSGSSELSLRYKIPAAEGDTLELTATCNLYGSKTVKITVKNQIV